MVMEGAGPPQHYHLGEDVRESKDLATSRPEKLKELEADYRAWNRQLIEPRWQTRRLRRKAGA